MIQARPIPAGAAVTYWPKPPTWSEVRDHDRPSFLAPAPRAQIGRAVARALAHPLVTLALARQGLTPKQQLAYLLWWETAAFFGVGDVRLPDGRDLPRPPVALAPRDPQPIGVVLIAQNEAARIGGALASVSAVADQVVVVDGGSTDETVAIAREAGAEVVERLFDRDFAAQKNAGVAALRTPWVLSIDADEELGPALADLLRRATGAGVDAVFTPRLNLFDDTGDEPELFPDVPLRLFRRNLRFRGVVHEQVVGWRTALHLPLTGPYVVHRKSRLRHYRAALLYHSIDPSPYTDELVEWMAQEVARLEGERLERPDH